MHEYLKRQVYDRLLSWKKQASHSTLEISGARQVGKTYLVNKFADEEYRQKIYINLLDFSGELFVEQYNDLRKEIKNGLTCENPVHELIKRYQPDFMDSPETVVIIDEIQESAAIYNRIREFTRSLKSDFIITGSYLGRILDKGFKYSAGDLDSLEIHTLNFEEFLMAMNQYSLYEELDLFGNSEAAVYEKLSGLYRIYSVIGGYPAVILQYLENQSIEDCQAVLIKIIKLFIQESKRYFEDILDFKAKARCYFMDVGLTNYFLTHIGCSESNIADIVNENFVYLDLKRRILHPSEIALETPAFATLGNGELDFFVKTIKKQKLYAVEVKTGKKNSKTVQEVLERKKADYILFAKGNTHGGVYGNLYTIPIYGVGKFKF